MDKETRKQVDKEARKQVDKKMRRQVDKETSGQEDKWTRRQVNGFAGKKGINFNVQEDSGKDNPSERFIAFLF